MTGASWSTPSREPTTGDGRGAEKSWIGLLDRSARVVPRPWDRVLHQADGAEERDHRRCRPQERGHVPVAAPGRDDEGCRPGQEGHAEHDPDEVTSPPVLLLDGARDLLVQVPEQPLVRSAVHGELREQCRVADQPTAAALDRPPEDLGHGPHHRDRREHDLGPVVRVHYDGWVSGRRPLWPPSADRALGEEPTTGL